MHFSCFKDLIQHYLDVGSSTNEDGANKEKCTARYQIVESKAPEFNSLSMVVKIMLYLGISNGCLKSHKFFKCSVCKTSFDLPFTCYPTVKLERMKTPESILHIFHLVTVFLVILVMITTIAVCHQFGLLDSITLTCFCICMITMVLVAFQEVRRLVREISSYVIYWDEEITCSTS